MVEIRRAVAADADAIARVRAQAWRETYTGLMPATVLDRIDAEVTGDRWRAILARPDASVWVAADADRIVGYAHAGAGRGDPAPAELELFAIYTLAEVHGGGVGWRLLEAAVGTEASAFLWVLRDNARARAFYERQGFRADGAEQDVDFIDTDGTGVPEVRMVRAPSRRDG